MAVVELRGTSPGRAYSIPAGHGAWLEGHEAFVGCDSMNAAVVAKPA